MKGDSTVIEALQGLLSDELAAVSQYMVHSEMGENWGYGKFAGCTKARAIAEMKHAEQLIARILFLEGIPDVATIGPIEIKASIPSMVQSDLDAELRAVLRYNDAIATAARAGDSATRAILETILGDEDRHVNDLESLAGQVVQLGEPTFLLSQV